MSIQLPIRSKAPISSGTVQADPSYVRRLGRQKQRAITATTGAILKITDVVSELEQEARNSRVRQEVAEIRADYQTLADAELIRQSLSGKPGDWENAGKLFGEFDDKIATKVLSNPDITGEAKTEFKLWKVGQRASYTRAASIQGFRMVVANEIANLPTIRDSFADAGDLKGFEDHLNGMFQVLSPALREEQVRLYHIKVVSNDVGAAIMEGRQIQESVMTGGDYTKAKEYIKDTKEYAYDIVSSSNISDSAKEGLLEHIDGEEASMKRDLKEQFTLLQKKALRGLAKAKWDKTLTTSMVEELHDKELISTPVADSYRSGLKKITEASNSSKALAYRDSSRLVTSHLADPVSMPKEKVEDALLKYVGKGELDQQDYEEFIDRLDKPKGKSTSTIASLTREATTTMDTFIKNTIDVVDFADLEVEEIATINTNIDLAQARASILFNEWIKEESKDGSIPSYRKTVEKTVEIMRQMRREVIEKESKEFFLPRKPYEGLDIKKLEKLDRELTVTQKPSQEKFLQVIADLKRAGKTKEAKVYYDKWVKELW